MRWFLHLLIATSLHKIRYAASENSLSLGLAFDTSNFDWVDEIFHFVLSMINDKKDGWHDDIFEFEDIILEGTVVNSGCDESKALDAYWNGLRKNNTPPHAIVGCRCSGASSMVARVAGLEHIPQVSPSSTSSKLSDDEEYPYFSRVIPTDDGRGYVGAMVAMLRGFGWNRVSILATDTVYAKDYANEFRRLWLVREQAEDGEIWEGEIAYANTILLDAQNMASNDSINQALAGVPTSDPNINSKVILLLAHSQHVYTILEAAARKNFQPDTIWIGIDSWTGSVPDTIDWMPPFPGYLGLAPYRNKNEDYQDFLFRLQQYQAANNMEVWESSIDHRVFFLVDSIVSLAKALSQVRDRRDGDAVTSALRNLTFGGVTGEVSFTAEGDRQNPFFTVLNVQREENGAIIWKDVAETGVDPGSVSFGEGKICFAAVGCMLGQVPSDKYPVPAIPVNYRTQLWALILLPIVIILLMVFAYRYWRAKQKEKALKSSISTMQLKMNIDDQLDDLNEEIEAAKRRKENLISERFRLQQKPETWTETDKTLVELLPNESEYWDIFEKLRLDMPDAHISKVWRVQNTSLWTYYSFHKDRFASMGIDAQERSVWHGTSSLDPEVIYNDKQDGFMMQFSQSGFWGRGIYFAERASYSHMYAYKPPSRRRSFYKSDLSLMDERTPAAKEDERELLLTKFLVGSDVFMNRDESPSKKEECRKLTVPPVNPATNLKYNTVSGESAGSKIWVVYENGRAYPEYLVRYYRSPLPDTQRTPYKNRTEANVVQDITQVDTNNLDSPIFVWEFLDNTGWKSYSTAAQTILEESYQAYKEKTGDNKAVIKTESWTYEINFLAPMMQTNLDHFSHTQRKVRRHRI